MMNNVNFADPQFFWLLIIIPLLIIWFIVRNKQSTPTLMMSTHKGFEKVKPTFRQRMRFLPFILRILALSLLIIVLARPQSVSTKRNVVTEGIDIILALDISKSMLAEDLKPNRLEAAKKYAVKFIEKRLDDRIGLVVFAGESFTQCPVTIDHDVIKNLFESVKTGMTEPGTAIGMGLATAVNRLKDSKAKSKVVILLTDGVNNQGSISPETAADIAKTFAVRVYTIGVGTTGKAPYPFKTAFGTQYQNVDVKIDEKVLKSIAGLTDGQYFRAKNNRGLEKIYDEIDKLEKTRVDESIFNRYSEEFFPLVLAALVLIVLEQLLKFFVFRSIP
ncbi:MAG: VWA domain-containing protein [Candidatus Kapabacteria bacterium]|nr:VWA domain-containing protein [Candidatus Kapabacteria bacterium]